MTIRTKQLSFKLFRVKNLYSPEWLDEKFKNIVSTARRSFLRYGDVSLFDIYDKKAAIYVASCEYKNKEDWLSIRFVPGDGNPQGTSDLKECLFNGLAIDEWLSQNDRLHAIYHDFSLRTISISKICGFSKNSKRSALEQNKLNYSGLKYTLHLFTLINRQFINDLSQADRYFSFITGLFRDELISNKLSFYKKNSIFPRFTNSSDIFGMPNEIAYLNRTASSYKFPSYFLNMQDLAEVFRELLILGSITQNTISYYLKEEHSLFLDYINNRLERKPIYLKNLSNMLNTKGKLQKASITGEYLRNIMDKRVRDGAKLKIMNIQSWKNDIQNIHNAFTK